MKIKKNPPKKLAPMPPKMKELIEELSTFSDSDLATKLDSIKEWPYPRGDLYNWIIVLDRFDRILEDICREYDLKNIQQKIFSQHTFTLLKGILRFSRLLLENCTNRNIYNSYEHLNDLLHTNDLVILETTLRLMLRPAQRLSSQRSLRASFSVTQDRILTLAQGWGTKDHGLEFLQLGSSETKIPEDLTSLSYQFYRTLKHNGNADGDPHSEPPVTPTPSHRQKEPSASKLTEGLVVINIPNSTTIHKSDQEVLEELVDQYQVPSSKVFSLFHRIRLARGLNDPDERKKLLIIRILAISIMAHVVTEPIAQAKLFLYEPDCSSHLAELLHPDNDVPFDIQTVALYAIDGIGRYRSKLTDILTAINASANHGILMYLLRKVSVSVAAGETNYPQDFIDALLSLIGYIITTQSGGNMVITAGIIPVLLSILDSREARHIKSVTRVVGLLDGIVYGFPNSFTTFCEANGIRVLVDRIQDEVAHCMEINQEFELSPEKPFIPNERTSFVKSMLKFILHMMQTSGTADGLRNLVDSTFPHSLKIILEHPKIFGSSIFGLVVNIMATFIHNEPTSLPILQEAKLPQAFLETIMKDIPNSADVISSIPNAFGAICLNGPGLDSFKESRQIEQFFSIFTSIQHLDALQDGDVPAVLGTSIDELIRHHPSLQGAVMSSIITMINRIAEMGKDLTINGEAGGDFSLQFTKPSEVVDGDSNPSQSQDAVMADTASKKSSDKKENIVVNFIEISARFLEGLFQNASHCKEFLKMGGLEILLKFYSLPTVPYDFSTSSASYSLSHLFRVMSEVDANSVVTAILSELHRSLEASSSFLKTENSDGIIVNYLSLDRTDVKKVDEANRVFRSLVSLHGFVGLLSDIYCTPVFSHSKNIATVIGAFTGETGSQVVSMLGELHRTCVWENIILKNTVPKEWYTVKKKSKKDGSDPTGQISNERDSTQIGDTPRNVDDYSDDIPKVNNESVEAEFDAAEYPKVQNTKYFKFLASQIPTCLTPLFQGLSKILSTRRVMEPAQKILAVQLASDISKVAKEHLTWTRVLKPEGVFETEQFSYYTAMLGLLSVLFLDERNQMYLQVMLVLEFVKSNGLECVFNILNQLWASAKSIHAQTIENEDLSIKQKLVQVHGAIEVTLNLFQFLSSAKLLHESPHLLNMVSKDKDRNLNSFDPHVFLVEIRSNILPVVVDLLQDDYIKHSPSTIVKSTLQNIIQILKGEGEQDSRPTTGVIKPTITSSVFNPRPFVPDENKIQQLIDMGFPRGAAEMALTRCMNHVGRAAEYLLTHPEAVAVYSSEGASTSRVSGGSTQPDAVNMDVTEGSQGETPVNPEVIEGGSSLMSTDEVMEEEITATVVPEVSELPEIPEVPNEEDSGTTKEDEDKGKEREFTIYQKYNEMRLNMKTSIVSRSVELLNNLEDIVFDVRDLLVLSLKDEQDNMLNDLINQIINFDPLNSDGLDERTMGVYLRLLALLLNDATAQSKAVLHSEKYIPMLIKMVSPETPYQPSSIPSWVAPSLLVIEACISLADEPKPVKLEFDTAEVKSTQTEPEALAIEVSIPDRESLMEGCLNLLETSIPQDIHHAVLRILVRLTRDHTFAVNFAKSGKIPLLFTSYKEGTVGFQGQSAYTIIILRHTIESAQVLKKMMEQKVVAWFTHPRPRLVDVSTYIRNLGPVALRDSEQFMEATKAVCRLSKYDPKGRSTQITLFKKEEEKNEAATGSSSKQDTNRSENEDIEMNIDAKETLLSLSTVSETLIHFLIEELMSLRFKPSKPDSELDVAVGMNVDLASDGDANTSTKEKSSLPTEEDKIFVYRCFLLQCLTELLASYPHCQSDVMTYNRVKKHSKEPHTPQKESQTPQKHRSSFLSHLLNDLLPYNGVHDSQEVLDNEIRKQHKQTTWAASVITTLCTKEDATDDKAVHNNLLQVKKFVLDAIVRSFKDAIASSSPADIKYGRFLALADLCLKILSSRSNSSGLGSKANDTQSSNVARMMVEKNFVTLLTNGLSEVDLNYPSSKTLTSALLRPLEFLSKVAIKMGKHFESSNKQTASDEESYYSYDDLDTGESEPEEAPDLYRNSSLGMFEGATSLDEDEDDDIDTQDEEDFDEGDFDEMSSDASDVSDEDDDDIADDSNVDMEIVIHPSYGSEEGAEDELDDDDEDLDDDRDAREMSWEVDEVNHVLSDEDIDEVIDDNDDPLDGEIHLDDAERDLIFGGDDDDDDDIEDDLDDGQELDPEITLDDQLDDGFGFALDQHRPFMHDEELFGDDIPTRQNRAIVNLGNRRHGRHFPVRRTLLEVGMHSDSFDLHLADNDQNRLSYADDSDFQLFGRLSNRLPSRGFDGSAHPLLINNLPSANPTLDMTRGRASHVSDWQSFEDMIGGSAVQLLEQLLNRSSRGSGSNVYRVDVSNNSAGFGGPAAGLDRALGATNNSNNNGGLHSEPASYDPLNVVNEFAPQGTSERWYQECRILYGNVISEKTTRLVNCVLNALIPIALEDQNKEKEAIPEEEVVVVDEATAENPNEPMEQTQDATPTVELAEVSSEPVAQDAETSVIASDVTPTIPEAPEVVIENTESNIQGNIDSSLAVEAQEPMNVDASSSEILPRTTVTIDGNTVDITDSGIDPTFLEALPEDLRAEVLNQHFRERQQQQQEAQEQEENDLLQENQQPTLVPTAESQISAEFLDALPPDIREEVLAQERLEQERRERQRQLDAQPPSANDMDPASFLASLDPQLRETVLMEQDEMLLSTLPPSIVAEANALRDRYSRRYTQAAARVRPSGDQPTTTSSKKQPVARDAIQLVDKPALASLIRLLFLPQPPVKNTLHRILLNLCENTKTRGDILLLLISILQDGGSDLAAVDKSFAQMTLRTKITPRSVSKSTPKGKGVAPQSSPTHSGQVFTENIPNLVAQRCLEALAYLVGYNEQAVHFFLKESEYINIRKGGKKGKGKDKHACGYPIVVLLGLLDRSSFLKSSTLMDQLMHLLATICKPLSSLARKSATETAKKVVDEPSQPTVGDAETTEQVPSTEVENISNVEEKEDNKNTSLEEKDKPFKPPVIPENCLRSIVNVLTAGECSSKTFQYTLSVIQYLSSLQGTKDVITSELVASAQSLGNNILADLSELSTILNNAMTGSDVQGITLAKFSPSSSQQAKLLRVLKTIDYIYSKKQSNASNIQTDSILPVSSPDPDATASQTSPPSDIQEDTHRDPKDVSDLQSDEQLVQIYGDLSFKQL
ncbi:E3 ubiquitin-protein ligase tom1, partial [Basidiobolus ranarum]